MSLRYTVEAASMRPPTGVLRLLYHDQTRAKLEILNLIDQFPAGQFPAGQFPAGQLPAGQLPAGQLPAGQLPDGQQASAEQLAALMGTIAHHVRPLQVSGEGGRKALYEQLRAHLLRGDKRAVPGILNSRIPDRRIRVGAVIAYFSFKPLLLITLCVALFRYGLSLLGYVIAALLAASVLIKLLSLVLGAVMVRKHPHGSKAAYHKQQVEDCLDSNDLAGAERHNQKLQALLLLYPDEVLVKDMAEAAAQLITKHRRRGL